MRIMTLLSTPLLAPNNSKSKCINDHGKFLHKGSGDVGWAILRYGLEIIFIGATVETHSQIFGLKLLILYKGQGKSNTK